MPRLSVIETVCVVVDIRTNATIKLPAVFGDRKLVVTDPTALPSTEFDCTSAAVIVGVGVAVCVAVVVAV